MKLGDTILYTNMESKEIIGVVISKPKWNEDHKGPAVKVFWMDDCSYTHESVKTIQSNDEEYDYMRLL